MYKGIKKGITVLKKGYISPRNQCGGKFAGDFSPAENYTNKIKCQIKILLFHYIIYAVAPTSSY